MTWNTVVRIPRCGRRAMLLSGLLLALLLGVGVARAVAAPPGQSADQGQALFQQKCAGCHSIGEGDRVGPDLKGVTARRDRAWLTSWMLAPDRMLAQQDPTAAEMLKKYNNLPMPNLGLTATEVAALVAYMEKAGGASAPTQAAPTGAGAAGDPALGKDLFMGVQRFQNGGAACLACHSVAGLGALGGGALGPDLTASYNKYGDQGMPPFLANPPFPLMNAIFGTGAQHPLTPQEQAHLTAFLKEAAVTQRPAESIIWLALLAVVGAAVLIGLAQLQWRGRLTQVRRPLVARSRLPRTLEIGKGR